jgi:hypothetical protein
MGTFVEVPAAELAKFLTDRKFTAGKQGHEVVYSRTSKTNPLLRIAVYSSVTEGAETARGCGEDAIRVVLLGKVSGGKEWCLRKTKTIHRTGSVEKVLARILDRIMEAAEYAKMYSGPCPCCGSPVYADSGRCVMRACREKAAA